MPEIDTFDEQSDLTIDERFPSVDPYEPDSVRAKDIVVATGEETDTFEAKQKFSDISQQAFSEVFARGQLFNKSAEQLVQEAQDLSNKQREFNENPDFVIEQALPQRDQNWDDLQTRVAVNYQIAQEVSSNLMDQTKAEGTSWFTYGTDFLGRYIFRQIPIGTYEDFTGRTERKGREILSKVVALPPKEFKVWMQNYTDEVAKEGFLSDKNLFAALALQEEVGSKGFDPNKELTRLLAVLDIPTPAAILKAGRLASKVGSSMKSTTAIGRVTAVAGDDAGQAAAESTLAKSADPETLSNLGDVATDLNAPTTPVRPSNTAFVRRMKENDIIQKIDHVWKQGGFGRVMPREKIAEVAKGIAEDYSAKINHVVHSGVDLVDEGLGVYVARFKLGNPDSGAVFEPVAYRAGLDGKRVDVDLAEEAGTVGGRAVGPDGVRVPGATRLSQLDEVGEGTEAASKVETKYEPPQAVIDMAEKVGPNAKVVQFDPSDASKGYLIEVSERIDTLGLPEKLSDQMWEATNLSLAGRIVRDTVGKLFNNSLTTSAAIRDNERLTVLAQLGQGGRAAIKEIVRPYEKAIKSLNSEAEYTLRAVYTKLRDGSDAHLRVRYTEAEFRQEYKNLHPRKLEATDKEVEAYNALATVEEADYILKATKEVQRYVAKGYTTSVEVGEDVAGKGIFVPAKRINPSQLEDGAIVRTVEGKIFGPIDEILDEVPEDFPVWKLDKPLGTGEKYIIQPKSSRMVSPSDVMGYNPGGSRLNPFANYFVVIGDGEGSRLKSLISAFSEVDGNKALDQIRTIIKAIDSGADNIDDIIKANRDWNPGIQNKNDFDEYAFKVGWTKTKGEALTGKLALKGRNDTLVKGDLDNPDIWDKAKVTDFIESDMRRNDKVLPEFGGGLAYNEDPVSSVFSQFGNSAYAYSNRAYTQNAMVGWVKAVQNTEGQKTGQFNWLKQTEGVSETDYETLFRTAEVTGTGAFARRMREMRNITLRRLDMQDEAADRLNRWGDQAAEYVFDGKLPFGAFKGKKMDLGDPTNLLLKVGFQSAFGFLNVSQFFMQGFHATSIMMISPVHGFKGAAMTFTQRGLLSAVKDPATYKEGIKRFAKAHDLTEETAEELMEYIRTSGRHIVDGDAIEAGTGIGFGVSGWRGQDLTYSAMKARTNELRDAAGKVLDVGLKPFNAGERLSRLTALNTAFLEFKKANPNVSAMSDRGRSWITSREQTLTFNMTTADKAMVQSSLMKVPTQWLSYSMRSMEAVFVGRGLSEGERLRLFGILGPMYGLSGFGFATSADYIGEKLEIEPDSSLYVGLKYGVIDGLSDYLLGDAGGAVGVGQRLAPINAFVDTYKAIVEEGTLQTLGGPSGEITFNILKTAFEAMDNLANGHTVSMTEDVIKVLRQPSGLNNIAKGVGILNNGIYRSKNGIAIPGEMDVPQALISFLGFTPLQVQEFYSRKGSMYNSDKLLRTFRKEVNTDAENAFRLIDAGDKRGFELLNEIGSKIALSGFAWRDQVSLRRAAMKRLESQWPTMARKLLRQDRLYGLQATESIIFPEENN